MIATTTSSVLAGSSDTLRTQRHRRQLSGANLFEVQSIEESSHRRVPSNGSAISNSSTSKPAELRADHLFEWANVNDQENDNAKNSNTKNPKLKRKEKQLKQQDDSLVNQIVLLKI